MNKQLLVPMILAGVLVTYQGSKSGANGKNPVPHFPLPSQMASVFLVFGVLSLFSGEAEKPAVIAGYGLDVAIALNLFSLPGTTQPAAKSKTTPTAKNAVSTAQNATQTTTKG